MGRQGEKGKEENCFQGRTQEACLIPAPSDVLLLFQLYLFEFCSLMKLDGPILMGILERCLPSCLLSPTPLHYCFTWDRVACVPLPGNHFSELTELNIPSDSWSLALPDSC